jgi:hypothetical protein
VDPPGRPFFGWRSGLPSASSLAGLPRLGSGCRRLAAARRLAVVVSESCRHHVEAFSLVVALGVIYDGNTTASEKASAGDGQRYDYRRKTLRPATTLRSAADNATAGDKAPANGGKRYDIHVVRPRAASREPRAASREPREREEATAGPSRLAAVLTAVLTAAVITAVLTAVLTAGLDLKCGLSINVAGIGSYAFGG